MAGGLKDLTKNTFILASPKVLTFFLRLVSAKLNALYIGTFGVGIVNQIQSVQNQLGTFATQSLNMGAKKLIISHNTPEGKKYIPRIVTFFTLAVLAMSFIIYFSGFAFYDEFSTFFLGSDAKEYFIYVFIFFPMLTLIAVPQAVLGALQQYRYLAKAEMLIRLIAFLVYLPLILFFGLTGVVINIAFTIVLTFALFFYFMQVKASKDVDIEFYDFKRVGLPRKLLKELGIVSSTVGLLGIISVLVELTIRGTLATQLGMEQIGLYAPIIAWSGFFSSLFMPALYQYIFPRYGECETNAELVSVTNNAFRMITFLVIPFVLMMISIVRFLLPIMYSREFLGAAVYVPLHFAGILFTSWMAILKQIFIPTGRVKQLIPFALAEQALYLSVVLLLVGSIGLWSWALRFSAVPMVLFIAYYFFLAKKIGFRVTRDNLYLMLYGLVALSAVTYLEKTTNFSFLAALGLCLILYFFMQETEKAFFKEKLSRFIN